jgi:hypothetical protein
MEIITIISILLPYFIFIIWAFNLKKDNRKLRVEFLKKLSTSETERDNLLNNLIGNVNSIVDVLNRNREGQDENWNRAHKYIKKNDELNSIQSQINIDNLEIFQEFDSIIQEIDKKVNTALDDQEKYSIKRDRYENRLTEVCKAFDSLKVIMNKNTKLTADNFGYVNRVLGSINENLDAHIENTKNGFELHSLLHDKTIEFMESTERILSKKQTLKEILENPIEVTKPSCETKLKMKEQVNQNDLESVTEIKNKVDFKHSHSSFKKGDIFVLNKDDLKVYRNKILLYDFHSWTTFGKNVMKKLLQLNEN